MDKLKILILDDIDVNLELLDSMLINMGGFITNKFNSPDKALQWCNSNIPDIVLVDYMMPEMNGIQWVEIFKQISEEHNEIPVIMITAYNEKEIKNKALEAGINDFLSKPFDTPELVARIRNMQRLRIYSLKLSNKAKFLEKEVENKLNDILIRENEIILRLAKATEFRDDDTYNHVLRMSYYSYHIAKNLGMDDNKAKIILKAAPMHDVGKIGVPDAILRKPGKLTSDEFEIIKKHTEIGYKILSGTDIPLLNLSADLAYSHHERYDGKGYPRGLSKNNIPISGRICAVADVFDALNSKRPYKKPWPLDKTLEVIKEESGKGFDPECVKAFLHNFDKILEIKNKYKD